MARAIGYLILVLAFTGVVYAATRSNICLISGSTVYRPLQLYPQDCPNNASNCMAAVYNYSAPDFMYKGPKSLYPNVRESWVYMTQDDSDNLDVVIITATSYSNNIIKTAVQVTGAAPGADTLVRDDPTEDTWLWNPSTNSGNFSWILQPGFTDGVVLGHFKLIDNYCVRTEFAPNWNGAISNIVFMTGTVAAPVRKIVTPLSGTNTVFQFCQYPQAVITSTDATCSGGLGSATATSLFSASSAKYEWTKDGVIVGNTNTVTGLAAGTYTVAVSVGSCTATRNVTINLTGSSCPKNCPPGTMKSGNDCAGCPAGTYSTTPNAATCTVCPPGSWNTAVNATSCNTCAANTISVGGTGPCTDCPASTSSDAGSTVCTDCPLGTERASGAATCTACAPGSYRCASTAMCSACPKGTFAGTSHLCTPCDPGTFTGTTGQTACSSCPANSYAAAGSAACNPCTPGTFAPAGSSVLLACM